MKRANVNVDEIWLEVFGKISKDGMKINENVNEKNWWTKKIDDKGFNYNPSYWKCECSKSCDVGEYVDYKNCKYIKRLVDKLVE